MSSDPFDPANVHLKFLVPPAFYEHPETGEVHHVSSGIDEFGREVPDSVPFEVPLEMRAGPTLAEQIRSMVRMQLSAAAAEAGDETFEEADDFEVEDDPIDPKTPYEAVFDPEPEVTWSAATEKRVENLRAEADRLEKLKPVPPAPKAPAVSGADEGGKKEGSPKPPGSSDAKGAA